MIPFRFSCILAALCAASYHAIIWPRKKCSPAPGELPQIFKNEAINGRLYTLHLQEVICQSNGTKLTVNRDVQVEFLPLDLHLDPTSIGPSQSPLCSVYRTAKTTIISRRVHLRTHAKRKSEAVIVIRHRLFGAFHLKNNHVSGNVERCVDRANTVNSHYENDRSVKWPASKCFADSPVGSNIFEYIIDR